MSSEWGIRRRETPTNAFYTQPAGSRLLKLVLASEHLVVHTPESLLGIHISVASHIKLRPGSGAKVRE